MYKISEQQILNPKVLSVANSCDNNENSKNGKNCLQTNARPPQKVPSAKIKMQKPRSGSKFSVQILGAGGGGWLWQKLITPLTQFLDANEIGRCNLQVARLRVNRLPSWIPQVGCYEPGSSYARNKPHQGVRPEHVLCL